MGKKVINIKEACIQDVIIRKTETDICFTFKDKGQEETKLFLGDEESVQLEINFGDTSNIGFGGTDNWGYNELPLYLDYPKNSVDYDGVLVNNITIQKVSDWCKCERLSNGALKYTALSENPTNQDRVTYFKHSTTDTEIRSGYNEGRKALKEWYVTIIQKANPNVSPSPEPTPDPDKKDLGEFKYKVGLLSDTHVCADNDKKSPLDKNDDWWDEEDFKRAMNLIVEDKDIKFVASCGDLIESGSPKKATPEDDSKDFVNIYDVEYWQKAGLRFFSPIGNHDFYGIFESREGDTITGKKNSETITGYNAGVQQRLGKIWLTGQQINGIVPGRGRIIFELENGKSTASGQADMRFFSYNDYVDLYARKGGYTGDSIWDSKKGGISDEAIKYAKNYVNSHWGEVKNNLVMWNDGGGHGRNGYSKLNYWLKKDNDIYIFLSLDYGNDIWPINNIWHDRMIHARTILNLNLDDPYIRRLKEYIKDTKYSNVDEPYNYQYYSPNTLIWLKEILENNRDKKIYVFTHHFMPSRVGNGVGRAKDGNWFYSVISPNGVKDSRESGIYNKGSNALTGIEYWFINKLMNQYKNVIWFSGHSHISFSSGINFDNHEYQIVSPSEKNEFVYTKESLTPIQESAWCVALPSMSKPRNIIDGQSVRRYEDAELGIMEVYEKGIIIKGYKIREDNKDVNKLLCEKIIKLI